MKLLMENWRKFLTEAEQGPYQIYCDMDGVLVDFVAGALKQINEDVNDKALDGRSEEGNKLNHLGRLRVEMKRGGVDTIEEEHIEKGAEGPAQLRKVAIKYMYVRLSEDAEFWAGLPWMPAGKDLWNVIKRYNPHILTAPMGKGSEEGKRRWIAKHLHPAPEEIHMSHDKFNWAMSDGQRNVLIDDFLSNIRPWKKNGGIAVHHDYKDPKPTLDRLAKIGFKVLQSPNEHSDEEYEERNDDKNED